MIISEYIASIWKLQAYEKLAIYYLREEQYADIMVHNLR